MESPLGVILANLLLSYMKKPGLQIILTLIGFTENTTLNIVGVFNIHHEAVSFLKYLNSRQPNIKFTMETETEKQFLFLDEFISNVYNNLTTSVFRKSTYTGLSLDFTSFTSRI